MIEQLALLSVPEPEQPPGIELRCVGVEELLGQLVAEGEAPSLIIADPPWSYSQAPGVASPDLQYATITDAQIAEWMAQAYAVAAKGSRLAMWCTWPKLGEWQKALQGCEAWRWKYKTGGSWHKTPAAGVGYHWLGNSEIVLLYTKGSPPACNWGSLSNAHTSPRQRHSEKPAGWMAGWIERWTEPGDLVVDLFAGLGPAARACALTGRRYIGAEIDPGRYRQAVDRLAMDKQKRRTHATNKPRD